MTTDAIRSPEAIATLERIGSKPGTSHRDLLTITRRIIRSERQALSRQANKLRQSGPLSQRRANALEQQANDHRADELANVLDVLEDYGRVLVLDREGYAKALGFEELADLLNINRLTGGEHSGPADSAWSIWSLSRVWRTAPSGAATAGSFVTARFNWHACWGWSSCAPALRTSYPSPELLAASASAPSWLFTMPAVRVWWSGSRRRYLSWYPRKQLLALPWHELVSCSQCAGSQAGSHARARRLLALNPQRSEPDAEKVVARYLPQQRL